MLALSNVSAGYGSFQALFGVSLEVKAGESVAVIGPNGAGKTTLLRAISKLIELTAGDVTMEGQSLARVPPHEVIAHGISQVPENRRLFPRLTVEENLKMGAFLPAARSRFAERCAYVYSLFPRMGERRHQPAGTLSGGEQQMCAIGRALMSGPKLLLLDEPSAGLAPVVVQSIMQMVKRICGEGYTVLIVEQNIRQVLKVVDRAYLLETGRIKSSGSSAELLASDEIRKAYLGDLMEIFDVFLLEAVLNGILLGGLLALLSLGLNLIFGVIDVVWICYAEMIMVGMYAVYALHVQQQWPLVAAMAAGIALVALLGALMHQFIIRPVLAAEPINQLLVTGGMLFFLQAAATLAFGIEFKNLGVRMAPVAVGEMSFSAPRLIAFAVAVAGVAATWLFLTRTYVGTAIRAISQDRQIMPLMGVNPGRIFTVTSALGGALAGLGGCLLVLQYDIHPAIGLSFGPITFLICVLGGLGNMLGGLIAAFIFAQFISVGGFFFHIEWGYVIAFVFFIAVMFWRPQGILGGKT